MRKRATRIADASSRNKTLSRRIGRGEHSREESLSAGRVLWFAKGTHRGFVNVGTKRYRPIAVELK
jgi:hypothetical protein